MPEWKRSCRRRGTMYVAVLGVAMVVTVIGVSAIMVTRVEGRVMRGSADLAAARNLAQGSIDLGLWTLFNETNWRTTRSPGAWRTSQPAGDGAISLSVADPVDGVFSNAVWEPLTFSGTGAVREARYLLEATAIASPSPLPALNTCLHASGNVTVKAGRSITLSGASLSMNGSVNGPGTITGNVEAGSLGIVPIVVGTSTIPSAAKQSPDAGVFDLYSSLATTIPKAASIDKEVLTADFNPWGSPNADGVYFMNTTGSNLSIKSSRIEGTLIIDVGTGTVTIDRTPYLRSFRADYPALIVRGKLVITMDGGTLSESAENTNFNPAGVPYQGASDADKTDTYPCEIQGLVHVVGNLTIEKSSVIRGSVFCEGNVLVDHAVSIVHTPSLYSNPPMGYVTYAMQIAAGGWQRIVNP